MKDGRITLRDGRALAFAEYGDPAGKPVFYFHGFPGSRIEAGLASAAASATRVRLIAMDRPGYGRSEFEPGRRIIDWADDVADLADALRIDRFAALGVSGGGPYLCACALRMSRRLTHAGIFCGLGPLDRAGATRCMLPLNRLSLGLASLVPSAATPMARLVAVVMRGWPGFAMAHFARRLPEVDRAFLQNADSRGVFIDSYREALRDGARGTAWDLRLYTRPWGFRQEDVVMPVHFWHGERDTIVPPSLARMQHLALQDCRARIFPDEGHFSVVFNQARSMLGLLSSGENHHRGDAR
jgi:pimeloyl-ACP methyl ester carboxylesterase